MVTQNELTRYSASSCFRWRAGDEQASPGCLVRIYPADNIGQVFELEHRSLTIGREADCDIHLHDDSVSRHHATIGPVDGGYVITDLGSTNGVYVGDHRVGICRLKADDRIRLGNQIFKYLASDHLEAQYHELVYKLMTTDGLFDNDDVWQPIVERGFGAVDMEAAGVAEACEEAGVDWSVYRGISDRPDEHIVDQAVFSLSKPDGSADPVAVAKYLARDPRRAKALAHLNKCMQRAARTAADAAFADLSGR